MFNPQFFYEAGRSKSPFASRLTGYYKFEHNYDDMKMPFAPILIGGLNGFSFINGKFNQALFRDNTMGSGVKYANENIEKYTFSNGLNDIPYSFSLWIYVVGTGSSYGVILGKNAIGLGTQNTNAEYLLALTPAKKLFFQKWSEGSTANWDRFTSVDSFPLNKWVHLGVTDNMGVIKFYFDGIEKAHNKTTGGSGFIKYKTGLSGLFGIFSAPGANSITYLYGAMDDLGIFKDSILTAQEMLQIATNNRELW